MWCPFTIEVHEVGENLFLAECIEAGELSRFAEDEDEAVVECIEAIMSRVLH